jgi:hypothetical protein
MDHDTDGFLSDAAAPMPLHLQEFNDNVTNLLLNCEELKHSLKASPTTDDVLDWRDRLEHLWSLMEPLERFALDAAAGSPVSLETDLFQHCQDKLRAVAQQTVTAAYKMKEPDPEDPHLPAPIQVLRSEGQASIARLTELSLLLLHVHDNNKEKDDDDDVITTQQLVDSYVAYQRQVLRLRAKPSIARLVRARQEGSFSFHAPNHTKKQTQVATIRQHVDESDDLDDDEDDNIKVVVPPQYHAPVLANILGQAAALIHPLMMWQQHLPFEPEQNLLQQSIVQLCNNSIQTINTQAQELVQTVATWFSEDRPMEEWMAKTADAESDLLDPTQLAMLDALVEEMAMACQVQARYKALLENTNSNLQPLQVTTLQDELLPEFYWKYAALERYLALQQWHAAVALAIPVQIVMDTNIHVPSVVEDAHYLSTRALQRAALTESTHAIGTVAHAISHDVWSTDDNGGVFQALLEERGCFIESQQRKSETVHSPNHVASPPRSGFESGFVSALMDALDEEEPPPPVLPTPKNNIRETSKTPNSGSFLSSLVGVGDQVQQRRLNADYCVLNGLHAACGACRALVSFLDSLLDPDLDDVDVNYAEDVATQNPGKTDKEKAMIQLAREDLFRYAESYERALEERIHKCLNDWCGSVVAEGVDWEGKCFPQLRVFFEVEDYRLQEDAFEIAEKDERLKNEMMPPLEGCEFLNQLSDKCESSQVLCQVGEIFVASLVELILDVLWKSETNFTDLGSLLLSKQVRLLQSFCTHILSPPSMDVSPPNLLACWERLSQVVCVLQLEKPADWLAYTSILTPTELYATMKLRTDFSQDAVQAVVARVDQIETTK